MREVLGHTDIKTTMRYAHLETRLATSKARDVINLFNFHATGRGVSEQAAFLKKTRASMPPQSGWLTIDDL